MYEIDTTDFSLNFEPYIDHGAFGDKNIERLRVKVTSYGFSADATMNVDKKWLADFAKELNEFYEKLEGGAALEEYKGHSKITFSFTTGGHIHVMGWLYKEQNSHGQELSFSNSIDQTELRDFAKSLYRDLCETKQELYQEILEGKQKQFYTDVLHVMLEKMRNRLVMLPERMRRLLAYHYGLGSGEAKSISESAAYFHLTEKYLRAIEKHTLEVLRDMMNDGKIV